MVNLKDNLFFFIMFCIIYITVSYVANKQLFCIFCARWLMFLDMQDGPNSSRTLDLTSSLGVGSAANRTGGETSPSDYNLRSVLTIAFQFPYELHLEESVAAMARQYVRSIVSAVQRVAMAISPSRLGLDSGDKLLPGSPEAVTLARWICQSYK